MALAAAPGRPQGQADSCGFLGVDQVVEVPGGTLEYIPPPSFWRRRRPFCLARTDWVVQQSAEARAIDDLAICRPFPASGLQVARGVRWQHASRRGSDFDVPYTGRSSPTQIDHNEHIPTMQSLRHVMSMRGQTPVIIRRSALARDCALRLHTVRLQENCPKDWTVLLESSQRLGHNWVGVPPRRVHGWTRLESFAKAQFHH
jgi:hypothetical protein